MSRSQYYTDLSKDITKHKLDMTLNTLDQVHCISKNIPAQKSTPIPFHPTQPDATILDAFDNSYGLVFKD